MLNFETHLRGPGGSKRRFNAFLALVAIPALLVIGCHSKPSDSAASPDPTVPSLFRDVTEAAGIRYAWAITGKRPLNILQTIGNGCAFLDVDQDGNLDILLVGSKLALYQGDGQGHFTDVTSQAGLDTLSGHFLGCAVGDYDNDGFPDIYLTAYRGGALLHNEPTNDRRRMTNETSMESLGRSSLVVRQFRNATTQAGITPQPWGTSAAFIETVPGSGRLDLVVAKYAQFGKEPGIPQLCEQKSVHGGNIMTSCGPRHYTPIKAVLFRNRGSRSFAPPMTLSMVNGRGLGVAGCDYDGSGRQGIAFANDETEGDLLKNRGHGTFESVGRVSGTALDRDGNIHGGMGMDWGDYDNDGQFDLFVATFQNESKSLYHNEGDGIFTDVAYPSGIGSAAYPNVAFGCKFLDYDNDGWLDIAMANGHVQDNIAEIDSSTTYRQASQLFRNLGSEQDGRTTFKDVSREAGADFGHKIVGRGLASGDYDNDGRMDLLLVDSEGKPLLLHNEVKNGHHWLGVRLIGGRSNRDGYGAIVTMQSGGKKRTRHCHTDGSYMSGSDPRVSFGLGAADRVEELTIRWPSGQVERLTSPPTDRYLVVREGQGMLVSK